MPSILVRTISKQVNQVSGLEVERVQRDGRFMRRMPPIEGDSKANVDVAYERLSLWRDGRFMAVVVRDSAEDLVFCVTRKHDHVVNPLHGEVLAMHFGLIQVSQFGLANISFKSYSLVAVSQLRGG